MNKLYALAVVPVLTFGIGYAVHNPQTKIATREIKQTVTKTQTVQAAEPVYRVGDTQGGVTLTRVYAPAAPLATDTIPPQFMLVAVEVSGINLDSNSKLALIYTSDDKYLQPHGEQSADCSNCTVFLVPKGVTVDSFIYKDFKWQL